MDANGFDRFAVSVADATSSRRSVLHRIIGGGLATALAALGISGFGAEEAEARSCKGRCRKKAKKKDWSNKKKKNCIAKCTKPKGVPGTPSNNSTITTIINNAGTTPPSGSCTVGTSTGCAAGNTCVLNAAGASVCVANSVLGTCTVDTQCATGFCGNVVSGLGVCLPCGLLGTNTNVCGPRCCVLKVCLDPLLGVCALS